jgi:L-lactate dehydrogenase complex protein LldE
MMRVGLFVTCFNDLLFPDVGKAVVRILEALGHEVEFPEAQTCCGQLHFNTGYRDACVPLVRRFAEAFDGYDAIVTPSASCAAMVRHHHATVAQHAGDGELVVEAALVAPRVVELTEFLTDRDGLPPLSIPFERAVALHPTCHSTRLLGIGDRPRRVLEAVPGLRLVDVAGSDQCCGFGGTFAVKNEDTSVAMGVDKVAALEASGADVVTAADTSCLMHLGGLLSRRRSRIRVMHLAEIVAAGLPA